MGQQLQNWAGPDGAYGYGRRQLTKGLYLDALQAFEEAEFLYRQTFGDDSPRVVDAMAQRAWCLVALGRFQDGVDVYRRALDLKRASAADGPPPVEELIRLLGDAEVRVTDRRLG